LFDESGMVWPELRPEEGDALFAVEALLGAALDLGLDTRVFDAGVVDETDGIIWLKEEARIGAELALGLDMVGVLLGWLDNVETWFEETEGMLAQ